MAKRRSQSDHDTIVKVMADAMVKDKFSNVKADIPGYNQPQLITWQKTVSGHIPDISGEQGESKYIIEAET